MDTRRNNNKIIIHSIFYTLPFVAFVLLVFILLLNIAILDIDRRYIEDNICKRTIDGRLSMGDGLMGKFHLNNSKVTHNCIDGNCFVSNWNIEEHGKIVIKFGNIWLTSKLNIMLVMNGECNNGKCDGFNAEIVINTPKIIYSINILFFVMVSFLIFVVIVMTYIITKRLYLSNLRATLESEVKLKNDNLIRLSSNLRHDTNTSLIGIENAVEELETILESELLTLDIDTRTVKRERLKCTMDNVVKMSSILENINLNLANVRNVINRANNIKSIRLIEKEERQTKGKWLLFYDIINVAFINMANYERRRYEHYIDTRLSSYGRAKNLSSGNILHIFMTHITNSIEANATNIKVKLVKVIESRKLLVIHMIDNGGGVPVDALPDIYKEDFSTKKSDDGIRGHGLPNALTILRASGGTERVYSTSSSGTIFELILPYTELENEVNQE